METVPQAEQFIERAGFTACLTDTRRPGPSLYVAVCGRRDAILPRNVQKDPECSQTWTLKDQVMRRGRFYYGKLGRRSAMFVAPRMIPYFNALWGMRKRAEKEHLSRAALAVLKVLRKEWEMGTADLRAESGVSDRKTFLKTMDGTALREVARCFLDGAGLTIPGELARVTGLSRPEAGLGNRALVKEGYAVMVEQGTYLLAGFPGKLRSTVAALYERRLFVESTKNRRS